MCIICVDLQKSKMTPFEARRALGEMREVLDEEHVEEVEALIEEQEAEKAERDT